MFRNDVQRGETCRLLVARLPGGPDRWFAPDKAGVLRPTEAAWRAARRGSPMSHGELLMLRAAIDVWNGSGGLKLAEAIDTLDARNLGMIGELLACMNGLGAAQRIDTWIAKWSAPPAPEAKTAFEQDVEYAAKRIAVYCGDETAQAFVDAMKEHDPEPPT